MDIEELKERLIKMGANNSQLNSKLLIMVLYALADVNYSTYQIIEDREKETRRLLQEARQKENYMREYEQSVNETLEKKQSQLRDSICQLEKMQSELKEKEKAFVESLKEMETPEARDRLRLANVWLVLADRIKAPINQQNIEILGDILSGCKPKDVI